MKKNNYVFIPGNVPSLKNSKIKTSRGIFPSKTVIKYIKSFGISSFSSSKKNVSIMKRFNGATFYDYFNDEIISSISKLKERNIPSVLGIHFIRDSERKFDFINACQIIFDLMTSFDIIEDDSMTYLIPIPLKINNNWYSIDRENPGVIIKLLNKLDK